MKIFSALLLCSLLLMGCHVSTSSSDQSNLPEAAPGSPEQQMEAEKAAREYLAMMDRGEYEKTWDSVGPAMRDQTSKIVWVNTLKLTRSAFDVSANRELEGGAFTTQVDERVPVGEYVVVQFKGNSGTTTTTEKIVMQKDQSTWKIVGYFINKRFSNQASN